VGAVRLYNTRVTDIHQAFHLVRVPTGSNDRTSTLAQAVEDRSYLWTVTRDGVLSYQLPSKAEIETQARRVYQLLTTGGHGVYTVQLKGPVALGK